METGNGRKNRFSSGLPTRPNATIRSPVAASMEHGRPAANTAYQANNALIFRLFCSLRLSVRTPPFHGGESGSIPLGSASYINGLAPSRSPVSNGCPISASRRAWIPTTRLSRSTRQTIPTSAPAADTACRHEAGRPSGDLGNAAGAPARGGLFMCRSIVASA